MIPLIPDSDSLNFLPLNLSPARKGITLLSFAELEPRTLEVGGCLREVQSVAAVAACC